MMIIENKYNIGQTVYLITDKEQEARIVTGLIIRMNMVIYYLSCGTTETLHYDFEISEEKDFVNVI